MLYDNRPAQCGWIPFEIGLLGQKGFPLLKIHPVKIMGAWTEGYALDNHIIRSEYIGDSPSSGRPQFNTIRTEIGEALFQLKYRNARIYADILGRGVEYYARKKWDGKLDLVIPMPPSNAERPFQPVQLIAKKAATLLNIAYDPMIIAKIASPQMKDLPADERALMISKSLLVDKPEAIKGKSILLVDDLYQTGATAQAVTQLLLDKGAKLIHLVCITKTRPR